MAPLNQDRSNLAEWLGWEVVHSMATGQWVFRWREVEGTWSERNATDLDRRQYDQVRALAFGDGHPGHVAVAGSVRAALGDAIRDLLRAEVLRSHLVVSPAAKQQRLGSVLALNAVLHLLGEPQIPLIEVLSPATGELQALRIGHGVGTLGQVVQARVVLRALDHWMSERGTPRHPRGTRPADWQSGEINGLAMAKNLVLALVKGENPYEGSALGRVDT